MAKDVFSNILGDKKEAAANEELLDEAYPLDNGRSYDAYKLTHLRPPSLDIRQKTGIGRNPGYLYLLDIVSGRRSLGSIYLIFTYMVVEIRGKNLRDVISALNARRCGLLQEFDPKRHDKPDADSPYIESITVEIKPFSDAMGDITRSLAATEA